MPVDRLPDGSWTYAPIGALVQVDSGARIVCHACGRPLTRLSAAHLRTHGLTQVVYRERYGLNRGTPLLAANLVATWRKEGFRRHRHLQAVRDGLAQGQAMAADGSLLTASHAAQGPGTLRQEGRARRSEIASRQSDKARAVE